MANTISTITPQQLDERRRNGEPIELVDVRTPAEYRAVHPAPARNVPLDDLRGDALRQLAERAAHQPLYVICQRGSRGRTACERLHDAGGRCAVNVEGGAAAWEQAGLPVVRGQGTISLERQVRIAAGLLVLAGAVLAALVHPAFIGLVAFLGAGLVFSGVADFCGMGILLAKMPWNRRGDAPPACRAIHA